MQATPENERMGPVQTTLVSGFESQTRDESPDIGVSPSDLAHGGLEESMLGFDGTEPSTDRRGCLEELHLVTGTDEPHPTHQSRETSTDDDDRGHLEAPVRGAWRGARMGNREASGGRHQISIGSFGYGLGPGELRAASGGRPGADRAGFLSGHTE